MKINPKRDVIIAVDRMIELGYKPSERTMKAYELAKSECEDHVFINSINRKEYDKPKSKYHKGVMSFKKMIDLTNNAFNKELKKRTENDEYNALSKQIGVTVTNENQKNLALIGASQDIIDLDYPYKLYELRQRLALKDSDILKTTLNQTK